MGRGLSHEQQLLMGMLEVYSPCKPNTVILPLILIRNDIKSLTGNVVSDSRGQITWDYRGWKQAYRSLHRSLNRLVSKGLVRKSNTLYSLTADRSIPDSTVRELKLEIRAYLVHWLKVNQDYMILPPIWYADYLEHISKLDVT